MATERVFLDEPDIFVSSSRVFLLDTTYATANITSVSKRFQPPKTGGAILLMAVGAVHSLAALVGLAQGSSVRSEWLAITLGLFVLGLVWFRTSKPIYRVVLASASGETETLRTEDEALVNRVVRAVNEAVLARG